MGPCRQPRNEDPRRVRAGTEGVCQRLAARSLALKFWRI